MTSSRSPNPDGFTVDIERFAFTDVASAYSRVETGDVSGRAVVDVT